MKYWWEYYLAKCIEKHFGEINIGDLNKIIFYMRIKLNFSVRLLAFYYIYGDIVYTGSRAAFVDTTCWRILISLEWPDPFSAGRLSIKDHKRLLQKVRAGAYNL